MTPDEFSKSMKDRGESFTQMFFRMMGQSIATQSNQASRGGDAALLVAMLTRDHRKIRRLMAEQLDGMEGQLAALNGDSGSTIITERNRRAFDVLKEQIAKGKRRIAVFYGAGHLPDMEERLLKDFRMKRKDEIWLTAWSLADPKKDKKPRKTSQARASLVQLSRTATVGTVIAALAFPIGGRGFEPAQLPAHDLAVPDAA